MKNEKIKVLYVDDERHNLVSFKANFHRIFDVYIAESASAGLEIMQSKKISVVMADHRMPEQSGVEFFEILARQFPDAVRIFITAYLDIDVAISAINKAHIYKYLTKPWDTEDLKLTIEDAHKVYLQKNQKCSETNEFVYRVTHDFKGPLASIEGLLNSVREQPNEVSAREYVDLIGNRVEHLERLLDELTEFITREQDLTNSTAIVFKTMLEEIVRNLEKGCKLSSTDVQLNVLQRSIFKSDKGILANLFTNSILNVIKYKNSDAVKTFISIDVITNDTEAIVEIEYEGLEIPEKTMSRLIAVNERKLLSGFEKDNVAIGTYINGLEKINGNMKVLTSPKKGTVITLRIPNYYKVSIY